MAWVAERPFSVGKHAVKRDDVLSAEMIEELPVGRLETLEKVHYVRQQTDEELESRVDRLTSQVDALAARVGALEKPRRRTTKKETA